MCSTHPDSTASARQCQRRGRIRPSPTARWTPTQWTTQALFYLLLLSPSLAGSAEFLTPAISADALQDRRGTPLEMLVVDVRPAGEYKTGHIAGAINIPHTAVKKHLAELSQATNGVVLYCTTGKRTRLAEETLLDNGVPNVFHLDGGLGAWLQGGHETHTGWGP